MSVDELARSFEERLTRAVHTSDKRRHEATEDLKAVFGRATAPQSRAVGQDQDQSVGSFDYGSPGPFINAQVALGNAALLQQADALMWQTFGLSAVAEEAALGRYPVVYCETLEEFFTPILADQDLSDTQRRQRLAEMVAEAAENAGKGGVLGVNLPGRGCYVNGWLFGSLSDQSAKAALQSDNVFSKIFATVAHEKLGHGFISDLTVVGQEKAQLGLWRFDLAQRFALRAADSPHATLLLHKHALIHRTSVFTEEGWATWIEHHMVGLASSNGVLSHVAPDAQHASRYTLEALGEVLDVLQKQATDETRPHIDAFVTVLKLLLIDTEIQDVALVFRAVRILHSMASAFDDLFRQAFGQPTVYVLGYLLLQRIADRVGWRNVPYAVMIAGAVSYGFERISVSDLESMLGAEPKLNVDARLVLLSRLELAAGAGYRELAHTARETYGFAVPEGWE